MSKQLFNESPANAYPIKDLREYLIGRFNAVREFTEKLCENMEVEDYVIQSMPDASPIKWHLAHTSWFFETFILQPNLRNYKLLNSQYSYLFNSYYVKAGERWNRPGRGLLSRPTVKQVYAYRKYINNYMLDYLQNCSDSELEKNKITVTIGLHHEQQHQELMLTDIKHMLSKNPLKPELFKQKKYSSIEVGPIKYIEFPGGVRDVGFNGNGFFYDNELPFHKAYLNDFSFANRLVTNGEFINFIEDDGYTRAELWLSDGFNQVETSKWKSPLYWEKINNQWYNFTLTGFREVNLIEPVSHVSFYEAEAFARWAQARLATESEWEVAAGDQSIKGNFVEDEFFSPVSASHDDDANLQQLYGDVWEWTRSDYSPYPGYQIPEGAIGEYNGKFMSGQFVLKGGSCATSVNHIRKTYRNFFYPHSRWQFMGIRLARDVKNGK